MPAAELPSDLPASHDLLHALLEVSLPGIILFRPVYAADGPATIIDLAYVQLNPAAQQMLGLPAQPPETFLTLYPNALETGIFAFYRDTFLSEQPGEYAVNYPYDGLDNFFLLSARRSGELLVVGFTDTAAQERSQVEQALRASQAREQAARAEAVWEKVNVLRLFEQATVAIALLQGPDYRVELANPEMHRIWGRTPAQTLNQPVFVALPDIAGQGFEAIFADVLQHGTPYDLQEVPVQIDRGHTDRPPLGYFHLMYRPQHDAHGRITGIITMAIEVTEQVQARKLVEQLNQELEARVAERTRELEAARATTERQRRQWEELFRTAPAGICIFNGPEWVYQFVNPSYQAMFPGRELLGKRLVEALPEVADQPLMAILHRVYDTGEPFQESEVLVPLARTESGPIEDIYFDLTYLIRRNEAGQIDGFVTYAYDVTERVRARREREAQQGELQRIFEQAPVGIAVFRGPKHLIEMANDLQLAIWDRSLEEALGKGLFELLPEVAGQGFEERLAGVLATGIPFVGTDIPASYTRHGVREPIYVSFVYTPLREANGYISAVVVVVTNTTEQVLARQAVEANAQRLRLLTDSLPVLIGYLDREERYQFTNEAYRTWFNQDPQALLGRTVCDIVGAKAYANAKPYIDRALAGERLDFESQMPYREGFVKYIRTSYVPDVQAGELHGFYTLVTDVTEQTLARRQVEQANQELEARVQERTHEVQAAQAATERERALLQALFAQAPVAIGLLQGEELQVASVNALMATLWGHTPEQLMGRPLLEGVPELRGQGFDDLMRQVLTTQVPVTGTETPATMLRDGELKTTYYNFVYQPLYDADGQVLGVIDIAVDVSEQVLARQQIEQLNQTLESRVQERTRQLAEQQAELRRLFAQAPVAIAVFRGPRYVIELANPAVCTLWGRTMAQTLGTPLFELLPEAAGQGFEELLDGVMATGVPYVAHELPAFIDRDGRRDTVYWDFVYQPLREAGDRITAITVVATDVSEQVLARQQVQDLNQELAAINEELTVTNEELNESNTQLTRTNVELDTFVYTASHDLKAPITNIEAILLALQAQLPAEVQQDEVVAQLLDMLQGTVTRFQLTITQLTDIAKLQLAHAGPAEPVPLAQVVEDVRLDMRLLLEQAATQLIIEVAPELVVSFSPANLRSVVYNLLSNAVKYRSPARPSQVRVRAAQTPQAVVLTVQDNGLGMSEVQQRQLFGLFQRLHTHVEGTGVGLYIVKRLVENGGGTITVQSQFNVGTTFTVTIPPPGA